MALPLERIEGKYEIVAKLREGGMGALYKVRHRLLDEIRVVKVLRSQLDDPEALRARFAEEARAAIKLRHPNVVQIFDFTLDDDGVGLIVMEHIDGIDLGQLISARVVPSLSLTLEIARQSLRALGFLHHRGFVHRDVSPDNLMLTCDVDGQPLVKIIDLGIAKHGERAQELTSKGVFLGKFRYASPEHFGESDGEGGIEPRSDLYAFGIVLYELLTGARPIQGDDASALIAGHLFRPALPFSQTDPERRVPRMMRTAVQRAIEKRPCDRFRDAAAFAEMLASVQRDHPLDDHARQELTRLLRPPAETPPPPPPPGSTQHRLDVRFGLTQTPAPVAGNIVEVASTTEASTVEPNNDPLDEHLARGCRLAAEGRHDEALEAFGRARALRPDNAAIEPLMAESRQRLAASRRWRDEVQTSFEAFETALDANDLAGAEHSLDAVRERVGTTNPGVETGEPTDVDERSEVRARLEAAREALTAAQTRANAIDTATESIRALIADDRLIEADVALFQATEAHGLSGRLTAMRQRLDDVHHRKLEAQVEGLISRAEAAAGERDFQTALDCAQRASVAAAEGPLADRVAELSAKLRDDANAHHRRRAILDAERAILRAIQQRDLDQARQVLGAAEGRFGSVEPFDALREILERTAHRDEDGERVNRLIRDAKDHLAAERYDDAIAKLEQASALAPDDQWIQDRLTEAEASRAQQEADSQDDHEMTDAIRHIEAARDAGDAMAAWRTVGEALAIHGKHKRLVALRDALAKVILDDA